MCPVIGGTDEPPVPSTDRRRRRRPCALLLPLAAVQADESPSAAPSAVPVAAESQAFTVGITDDVDSLNPFTGIVAPPTRCTS